MATLPEKEADHEVEERTKPPFLRRVRIRGYKSIAFCDVELEPLTILLGRNAAGKSNFLDALAFVRDALATNIPEATNRHGGWHSMLSRFSQSGEISFELEISPSFMSLPAPMKPAEAQLNASYGFLLKPGPVPESPILAREWFRRHGASDDRDCHYELTGAYDSTRKDMRFSWEFAHPEIACSQVPYPHPDRLWISSFGKQPFLDSEAGLRRMALYNFVPEVMRPPQRPPSGHHLDQHGVNLASVLDATRRNDEGAFQRIGSYLSAVVPDIERFEVARHGDYKTVHFWMASTGPDKKLDFDASSMSDGTLRVLAALTAAFQNVLPWGNPSVVGIEEPEAALHPAAMRALVAALDEATLRTQILLTTHSPDLLDAAEVKPANVRVVRMIDGRTEIGRVDEASVSIVRDHLSSLGGLERDRQLEPDPDDLERQAELGRQELTSS